jgi:hypothetical protein
MWSRNDGSAYPSLVQLPRNGVVGDNARFPKLMYCRSQSLGSRICGTLECQPHIHHAPPHGDQTEAQ